MEVKVGYRYRHVKSDKVVLVISLAKLQTEFVGHNSLEDMEEMVVYREHGAPTDWWIRSLAEFSDGRFILE